MQQLSFVQQQPKRRLVREMPESLQPQHRLRTVGPEALSTTELVACVLQAPDALSLAEEMLVEFKGIQGVARASEAELRGIQGMGPAQSARLKASIELGRRILQAEMPDMPMVRSPSDMAQLLMADMGYLEQEHFVVIHLDTRNKVIDRETLYVGSLNTAAVRTCEVFRGAIRNNAAAIIIAHNHPSGDPTPSPEDVSVTKLIVAAAQLVEIECLDHLVIGRQRFVSLHERGLGFS